MIHKHVRFVILSAMDALVQTTTNVMRVLMYVMETTAFPHVLIQNTK